VKQTAQLGYSIDLSLAFPVAITVVKSALKSEGFGVLTEIDMQAAFREKLGEAFRPYAILGACNPPLAFAALSADPAIGLLLPCNATVELLEPGKSRVRLVDPRTMLEGAPTGLSPELAAVADDAHARIERVVGELRNLGASAQ
jgi:uncharacterized protein (DUF302 family)